MSNRDINKCSCTIAQTVCGDGCQHCNPDMVIELLEEENATLQRKLDIAVEALNTALPASTAYSNGHMLETFASEVIRKALAKIKEVKSE